MKQHSRSKNFTPENVFLAIVAVAFGIVAVADIVGILLWIIDKL